MSFSLDEYIQSKRKKDNTEERQSERKSVFSLDDYITNKQGTFGEQQTNKPFSLDKYMIEKSLSQYGQTSQDKQLSSWAEQFNTFSQKVHDDYTARENVYQSPADFDLYQRESSAKASELLDQIMSSKDYYSSYGDLYDNRYGEGYSTKMLEDIEQSEKYLNDVVAGLAQEHEYWKQWENEEAYNKDVQAMANRKQLEDVDLDSLMQAIDMAQSKVSSYDEFIGAHQDDSYELYYKDPEKYYETVDYEVENGSVTDTLTNQQNLAKKELQKLQNLYRQAEQLQLVKPYLEMPDIEEFAAKGAAIENPTALDVSLTLSNKKKRDMIGNIVTFAFDSKGDETMRSKTILTETTNNEELDEELLLYSHMTDEEVKVHNYLLGKEEYEKAAEILRVLRPHLTARNMAGVVERNAKMAEEHPFWSSLASPLYAIPKGAGYINAAWDSMNGKEIDPNDPMFSAARGQQAIRGTVSRNIKDSIDNDFLGSASSFLYETGMSVFDFLLVAGMTSGMGAASEAAALSIMGTGAATDGMLDAYDRGGSQEQALAVGFWSGAAEVIFEKISLDNFIKIKSGTAKGTFVRNALKQSGIEASEEFCTEIANKITDAIYMGDMSHYNISVREYVEQGLSPEEAKRKASLDVVKEIGLAALGGFMSGGAVGSVAGISNNVSMAKIGQNINEAGKLPVLLEAAKALPETSEAHQIALQLEANEQTLTAKNIGVLYSKVMEAAQSNGTLADLRTDAQQMTAETQEHAVKQGNDIAYKNRQGAVTPQEAVPKAKAELDETQGQAFDSLETQADTTEQAVKGGLELAKYNDSGAEVLVKGISSVEDGNVIVELEDNGRASADDITFENEKMEQLYDKVKHLETEAAKTFMYVYEEDIAVNDYYLGFTEIYAAARTGVTFKNAVKGIYSSTLPKHIQKEAYNAGLQAGSITQAMEQKKAEKELSKAAKTEVTENTTPAKNQEKKPSKNVNKEDTGAKKTYKNDSDGVIREHTKKVTAEQEKNLKALDAVFKVVKKKIVTHDSIDTYDQDGKLIKGGSNSYFDPETNVYHIALDSVGEAYIYFAVHESVHDIAVNNKQGYDALEKIVLYTLVAKGENIDNLIEVQRNLAPGQTKAYYLEEVVANTVPSILTDPRTGAEFVKRFAAADKQTRTVFEKLLEAIRRLLVKAYNVLKNNKSWQQMKAIEGDIKAIANIRTVYFAALEGTVKQQTKSEGESVIRYSKNDKNTTSIKEQLRASQNKVNDLKPVANIRNKGWKGLSKEQMAQAINNSFKGFGEKIDRQGFGIVLLDKKRINMGLNYVNTEAEYAAFFAVPHVIKRGVAVGRHFDHKGRGFETITFAAPVVINGVRGNVAVNVKQDKRNVYKMHRILMPDGSVFEFKPDNQNTELTTGVGISDNGNGRAPISSVSKNSLSQKDKTVKKDGRKFSLKDTDPVDIKKLETENAKLQEAIKLLKAQFKVTKGHQVSKANIEKLAKKILKDTSSEYKLDVLTENLQKMFEYLANTEQPVWDDIKAYGVGMAKEVLNASKVLDKHMYEEYADLRKHLRSKKFKLSDVQREEAANLYGTYRAYRQALFGNINLTTDGTTLDQAWKELCELWPSLFSSETNEGDQVAELDWIIHLLRPQYVNPYGFNMDDAAYDLFLSIYKDYFNVPEFQSFADKKAKQLQQLKNKYRNKINDIRQTSKERYTDRLKTLQAKYAEKLKTQRIKNANKIVAIKAKYKERVRNDKAKYFDTNAAKAFTAVYEPNIPVNDYYLGFTAIHGAARTGTAFEQAVQLDEYTAMLPSHIQQAAYNAGVQAGAIGDDASMINATSVRANTEQLRFNKWLNEHNTDVIAKKQEIIERFKEAEANGDIAEMNKQRKEYQALERWSKETIRDKKVQIGKAVGGVLGQMVSSDLSVADAVEIVRENTTNIPINDTSPVLIKGEQYTKSGPYKVLKQNTTYKSRGGHSYNTDSQGRITKVRGKLELGEGKRNNYAQKVVGRKDRLSTDDGGHLIARKFKGSGDLDNLVPMDSGLNRAGGDWYRMEQEWENALKDGTEVYVEIDAIYKELSQRPKEFVVKYIIDGDITEVIWENCMGGKQGVK